MSDDAQLDTAESGGTHDAGLPGVVRLGASAWWHTTAWAVGKSVRISGRLLRVAIAPETAPALVQDIRDSARNTIRDLIDITDLEQRLASSSPATDLAKKVVDAVPLPSVGPTPANGGSPGGASARPAISTNGQPPSLRAEGEELLRRSRDVHYSEDAHPAYERILSELAPDEARILRLMLLQGPQASVDVRTGGPLGLINSQLIAPGLTMIGARAGCRYVERVPSYLNNLFRLGLIWFSRETLRDPMRYQVLEAQPDVLGAVHSVRYARIVRRSIHLTPFGEDFCRVTFALEAAGRSGPLPEHSSPPQARREAAPPAVPGES